MSNKRMNEEDKHVEESLMGNDIDNDHVLKLMIETFGEGITNPKRKKSEKKLTHAEAIAKQEIMLKALSEAFGESILAPKRKKVPNVNKNVDSKTFLKTISNIFRRKGIKVKTTKKKPVRPEETVDYDDMMVILNESFGF